MKINSDSKIMIVSDAAEGAYHYQHAFDCVTRNIYELGHSTFNINPETTTLESYKKTIAEFGPDLIFCYLQKPFNVIKMAGFLKKYHPVPAINWYLEDPNAVVSEKNNTDFFGNWKNTHRTIEWDEWEIEHLPRNRYLVGKQ